MLFFCNVPLKPFCDEFAFVLRVHPAAISFETVACCIFLVSFCNCYVVHWAGRNLAVTLPVPNVRRVRIYTDLLFVQFNGSFALRGFRGRWSLGVFWSSVKVKKPLFSIYRFLYLHIWTRWRRNEISYYNHGHLCRRPFDSVVMERFPELIPFLRNGFRYFLGE